jgi:hypothetical protein
VELTSQSKVICVDAIMPVAHHRERLGGPGKEEAAKGVTESRCFNDVTPIMAYVKF